MTRRSPPAPRYLIEVSGVATGAIFDVAVDGRYWLAPMHPVEWLAVIPMEGHPQPTLSEVTFYADVLAYDHDSPTIVRPYRERPLVQAIARPKPWMNSTFYDDLQMGLEAVWSMRFGGSHLEFRWGSKAPELSFTQRLGAVSKEVSLYAMATRQLDPLAEFLCLYRVLESVSRSNATTWVESHVGQVRGFRFGRLELVESTPGPGDKPRVSDVFSVLRRRATARLRSLERMHGTPAGVAQYLYGIRNDIAHGKTTVRAWDHGATVQEVGRELPLMRLLARLAIEKKRLRAAPHPTPSPGRSSLTHDQGRDSASKTQPRPPRRGSDR